MQISSIFISPSVPLEKAKSAPAPTTSSTDNAVMKFSADSFSNLVLQANQMPDVRSDVVDSFRSRIQAGQYPTPDTMDNLTDVLGPSIVQLADSSTTEG